jgi:hypothetical protein
MMDPNSTAEIGGRQVARPHIESIHAYDVAAERVDQGTFAGTMGRVLSADDADGSSTSLVTFPAGWSGNLASNRPVELFVLTGDGDIGGRALRPGTWAWVPSHAEESQLSLANESDVIVMVEPERPDATGPVEVIDSLSLSYKASEFTTMTPGLVIKDLRHDPETRDRTWIAGIPAGWYGPQRETHPTVEEAFLIRGDCLLDNSGPMIAGDYFWRPGGVPHCPSTNRTGSLFFFRTKGGALEVEFEDVPDWSAEARRYYDAEPYFARPTS